MENSKAVIYTGGKPVSVNFNKREHNIIQPDVEMFDVDKALIVFNSFENQLRNKTANSDKFIKGLSIEINNSLSGGGMNCFYSSFDEYSRMDLPHEFSTIDDDLVIHKNIDEFNRIFSLCKNLKEVKIVGVVSNKEIDEINSFIADVNSSKPKQSKVKRVGSESSSSQVVINLNSDFLVVV